MFMVFLPVAILIWKKKKYHFSDNVILVKMSYNSLKKSIKTFFQFPISFLKTQFPIILDAWLIRAYLLESHAGFI